MEEICRHRPQTLRKQRSHRPDERVLPRRRAATGTVPTSCPSCTSPFPRLQSTSGSGPHWEVPWCSEQSNSLWPRSSERAYSSRDTTARIDCPRCPALSRGCNTQFRTNLLGAARCRFCPVTTIEAREAQRHERFIIFWPIRRASIAIRSSPFPILRRRSTSTSWEFQWRSSSNGCSSNWRSSRLSLRSCESSTGSGSDRRHQSVTSLRRWPPDPSRTPLTPSSSERLVHVSTLRSPPRVSRQSGLTLSRNPERAC